MAGVEIAKPGLEEVRFAADASWLGPARGLGALERGYRIGRQALYWYFSVYWWLGSWLGGPRTGGKQGPLRRALTRLTARRRAARRAPEVLAVHEAAARTDGDALAVRGRIRAFQQLAPALHGEGVVVHRVDLDLKYHQMLLRKFDYLVYEAACDFDLEGEHGTSVRVEVARATLVVPAARKVDRAWAPITHLRALYAVPEEARRHMSELALMKSRAGHTRLRAGDRVTVYGWKGSMVDPTVSERLERDTPIRTVLRSGPERMLIFRAE